MGKFICTTIWLLAIVLFQNNHSPDLNQDGIVDILDLTLVSANLDTDLAVADINNDGMVDIFDLVLVAYAYGDVYSQENIDQKIYLPIICHQESG